jgi:hypothetical protein
LDGAPEVGYVLALVAAALISLYSIEIESRDESRAKPSFSSISPVRV